MENEDAEMIDRACYEIIAAVALLREADGAGKLYAQRAWGDIIMPSFIDGAALFIASPNGDMENG